VSRISEFLKTTLVGGLLFLVPVILLGLVLRRGLEFAGKVDGDAISGNVKLGAFGNASFSGTRAA